MADDDSIVDVVDEVEEDSQAMIEQIKEDLNKINKSRGFHEEEYSDQYISSDNTSFGDQLLSEYLSLFDKISTKNEIYAHQTLHLLVGQLVKHIKIYISPSNWADLRNHVFYIADSGCLYKYTRVRLPNGKSDWLGNLPVTFDIISHNFETNEDEVKKAIKIDSGKKELFEIKLENGRVIKASEDHIFYLEDGREIKVSDLKIGNELFTRKQQLKIKSIKKIGAFKTYDLQVEGNHNFYLSNGVLSHNSGKSSARPLLRDACKELNIRWEENAGEITEAALVGSYDVHEDPLTGARTYVRTDCVFGKLQSGGILFFDEANIFLMSQEKIYNKNIIGYMTAALNPIGLNIVTKAMKGGEPIVWNPEFSLCAVTWPIKTKMLDVLRGGLLQRTSFNIRKLEHNDWLELGDKLVEMLDSMQRRDDAQWKIILVENKVSFDSVISKLKEIRDFAATVTRLKWDEAAKKELLLFNKMQDEALVGLSGDVQEIFNTFRSRNLIEVTKLAAHRALMDKRDTVLQEDFTYASHLVLSSLKSMIDSIENLEEVARKDEAAMIHYEKIRRNKAELLRSFKRENGSILRSSFVEICSEHLGVSAPTMYRYIKLWEKKGLIRLENNKFILW